MDLKLISSLCLTSDSTHYNIGENFVGSLHIISKEDNIFKDVTIKLVGKCTFYNYIINQNGTVRSEVKKKFIEKFYKINNNRRILLKGLNRIPIIFPLQQNDKTPYTTSFKNYHGKTYYYLKTYVKNVKKDKLSIKLIASIDPLKINQTYETEKYLKLNKSISGFFEIKISITKTIFKMTEKIPVDCKVTNNGNSSKLIKIAIVRKYIYKNTTTTANYKEKLYSTILKKVKSNEVYEETSYIPLQKDIYPTPPAIRKEYVSCEDYVVVKCIKKLLGKTKVKLRIFLIA
ncbi:hypothetical protein A3Q56_03596 [Intoshia linei]|uniref:Uncharacterized protein n=1 Tax=Intoshia linei TaxID=1819745 RepID=A0A177B301_9BILA|nr:hypothetical protein A3Q56_03596 [Intoshia linei]